MYEKAVYEMIRIVLWLAKLCHVLFLSFFLIFIVKVVFGLYYISSSQAKPPDSLTTIFNESKRIGYLASEDDIIYDFHLSFGVFIFQKIS